MKFLKRFSNDVQLCKTEKRWNESLQRYAPEYVLTDGWSTSYLSFRDGQYQHDGQFKLPSDAHHCLEFIAWQIGR